MESVVSYTAVTRLPFVRGQAGIDRLRELSSLALGDASERIGAPHLELETMALGVTELGAPRASNGWHISKTHTEGFAAAGVSRSPLGIDAEWILRPRLRAARESAADCELEILDSNAGDDAATLVLLWTGKEAVLKQSGLGLTGISRCRLVEMTGPTQFVFELDGERYPVHSTRIGEYWLSVSTPNTFRLVELDANEAQARLEETT